MENERKRTTKAKYDYTPSHTLSFVLFRANKGKKVTKNKELIAHTTYCSSSQFCWRLKNDLESYIQTAARMEQTRHSDHPMVHLETSHALQPPVRSGLN